MSENLLTGKLRKYNPEDCFDRRTFMMSCSDTPPVVGTRTELTALWMLFTAEVDKTRSHDRSLWFLTVCRRCLHLTHDCNCMSKPESGIFPQIHKDEHWLVMKVSVTTRLSILEELVAEERLGDIGQTAIRRLKAWAERGFEDRVGREAV